MSILKVNIAIVPLFFFLISYSLVPKIKICLKYFWTKIPKSSHCELLLQYRAQLGKERTKTERLEGCCRAWWPCMLSQGR